MTLPTSPPSPPVPPAVAVAIGVLVGPEGVLIAQRRAEAVLGGLWEFPGGKIEPDETPAAALAREFGEELGLRVDVGEALPSIEHRYDHATVELRPFWCSLPDGVDQTPEAHAVAQWRWVAPQALADYRFPEANRDLLQTVAARLA